jgi:hypothetical protein
MNSKSFLPSQDAPEQSAVGVIVFLMMALVFVPVIAAHAVMIWHDQLTALAPPQLAAFMNLALSVF